MKALKPLHDFKGLELQLSIKCASPHMIFFKEHVVREHTPDKPSGRTLFIVNVPPYVDEKGIIHAFSNAGKVQSVQFAMKPSAADIEKKKQFIERVTKPCFRVAYVVFNKVSELDKALKLTTLQPMNSKDHEVKLGINKWIEEFNDTVMNAKTLKERVEEFIRHHDEETAHAVEKDKEMEQADDEGWVTVTKRGKVQSFARTENVESKIMVKEEQKRKRKELRNFYTFQIRDSKMKHIVALRQKFEEDKKKIAQIKQSRRFKPF